MRRIVLLGAIVVAVAAMGSIAAQGPDLDLAGVYNCDGMNPDGSPYHGIVEISKLRNTYRVRWTMDDGSITGVGIYSGGVFAVSYFGGAPAVVVYKVDGSNLVGEWTMGGIEGTMYTEKLEKTAAPPPTTLEPRPQERQEPGRRGPGRARPGGRGIQL